MLIDIFNGKGKSEAIVFVRKKYNLSFQQFKRRLNRLTNYYFDKTLRIYKHNSEASIEETPFMTIDELDDCKSKDTISKGLMPLSGLSPTKSFDDLVKELIKDRLMELSKYVSINYETRSLIINTQNLKKDCFHLIKI